MVDKHTDDTSNCTMTWKFHIVEQGEGKRTVMTLTI